VEAGRQTVPKLGDRKRWKSPVEKAAVVVGVLLWLTFPQVVGEQHRGGNVK